MTDRAGAVSSIVESLKQSPVLLALLGINLIFVVAAVWFLSSLASAQGKRAEMLMQACLPLLKPH